MNLVGALFFVTMFTTMNNFLFTVLTFQNERPVFLREQANKMYKVPPYYGAKIMLETPLLALLPMLTSIIVYFKIGTTIEPSLFFYFYCVLLLVAFCGASFGYLLSSIFSSAETAVQLSTVIMMPIILFGGFYSNSGNYMSWISWIQWLSPIRYGFEGLI